jgi:hypothetical protein
MKIYCSGSPVEESLGKVRLVGEGAMFAFFPPIRINPYRIFVQ